MKQFGAALKAVKTEAPKKATLKLQGKEEHLKAIEANLREIGFENIEIEHKKEGASSSLNISGSEGIVKEIAECVKSVYSEDVAIGKED